MKGIITWLFALTLFHQMAFALDYELFIPESARNNPHPSLMVMLHGCTQNPKSFMDITKIKEKANKQGFIVLAPHKKLTLASNPLKCWAWYWPNSNRRDSARGDIKAVMDLIQEVKGKHQIDDTQVFAMGFSAGGVMASIMASCYPNVFRGVAIHSGIPYKGLRHYLGEGIDLETYFENTSDRVTLESITSQMTPRERSRILKLQERRDHCSSEVKEENKLLEDVVIFTGSKDKIAFSKSSPNIFFQFVSSNENDWFEFSQFPSRANQHAYKRFQYEGSKLDVNLYQVDAMGHAWSGGSEGHLFSDPNGPDATSLILENFNL